MAATESFKKTQFEFAGYIRDPENMPAPDDVELRRMKVYRELFFNNVESFMSDCYPVLHEVLGEERWHRFVYDYFRNHQAKTPLFPVMPSELLDYLENEFEPEAGDPPFMLELAQYEWMEMELATSDTEADFSLINANGDLLEGIPVMTPLAAPMSYQYPVHQISADNQPVEAPETPTYLLVYRDRQDIVGFTEINALTYRLLQLIAANDDLAGEQLLQTLCSEIPGIDPKVIMDGGTQILNQMQSRGILLGTRI